MVNYRSVKTFAKANNLISTFKFIVPLLVIVVLYSFFRPENLEVQGFAPFGMSGIEMAVSGGGIIFAYLGLTPIISVASEVRNPQRTIPIALILSVLLSTAIYVLLQVAFLGSVPTEMLANGWGLINKEFSLPYRDIAVALGVGWLAYGGRRRGDLAERLRQHLHERHATGHLRLGADRHLLQGVHPHRRNPASRARRCGLPSACRSSGPCRSLPGGADQRGIGSPVLSYAVAPVSVAALRRSAPDPSAHSASRP